MSFAKSSLSWKVTVFMAFFAASNLGAVIAAKLLWFSFAFQSDVMIIMTSGWVLFFSTMMWPFLFFFYSNHLARWEMWFYGIVAALGCLVWLSFAASAPGVSLLLLLFGSELLVAYVIYRFQESITPDGSSDIEKFLIFYAMIFMSVSVALALLFS